MSLPCRHTAVQVPISAPQSINDPRNLAFQYAIAPTYRKVSTLLELSHNRAIGWQH